VAADILTLAAGAEAVAHGGVNARGAGGGVGGERGHEVLELGVDARGEGV
jgi:hypothetical protein